MNDVIEAAARVLFEDSGRKWSDAEEWERNMERATAAVLHKAGMLATREEGTATRCGHKWGEL